MIRDGLIGHDDFPPETPVLAPKPPDGPLDLPAESMANMDRVYWVLTLRKELIDSGNLVETDAMRAEFKKLSKVKPKLSCSSDCHEHSHPGGKDAGVSAPPGALFPAPLSAAVRTPAGDYVPPPVDFKVRASGERDDPDDGSCPF